MHTSNLNLGYTHISLLPNYFVSHQQEEIEANRTPASAHLEDNIILLTNDVEMYVRVV